jgi:hypothetical protein
MFDVGMLISQGRKMLRQDTLKVLLRTTTDVGSVMVLLRL